jgi:predicted ATP-dependent serine protease
MVDAMFSLDIERKEQDFLGCRILQTEKNRFGGSGHIYFLTLRENGFQEVSRITIG